LTTLTQEERILGIETPLGPNALILRSFTGTESVSRPFHFELDLVSENGNLSHSEIIGRQVSFRVRRFDDTSRFFHGYVTRFVQMPGELRLARYQASVDPWLWFLTRTSDCKIFQNKTIPEIVQQVFRDFGFRNYEIQTVRDYPRWEYCVQYRETAFNFISRLLEQEGIFYFFRHEERRHVLVIGDDPSAHKPWAKPATAPYQQVFGPGMVMDENVILSWQVQHDLRPGKYAVTDYNFEAPSNSLLATVETNTPEVGNTAYEIFDFPAQVSTFSESERVAKLRMEEEETPHTVAYEESSCRDFSAGFRFDLVEHPRKDQNGRYLITSVTHSAHTGAIFPETDATLQPPRYSNAFTCIPFEVPFRPPRVTPKPVVQGAQTAVVVGPDGEEIHTDKYGRVKVQFFWDRYGKKNEESSCWIRVSHPWAGKGWGAVAIPRIGQEVVIGFLEGDPDQPLIVGRVYNAEQMPPYGLPGGGVISGVKSNSTKGGGGYNELSFDDTKGTEKITIHGQYDMNTVVEHDQTSTIHNNRTDTIDVDDSETVGNNQTLSVGVNQNITIGSNQSTGIGSNQTTNIGANKTLTVGANREATIGSNDTLNVGASSTTSVALNASKSVGSNQELTVGANYVVTAGAKISLTAGASISLTVGASNITISPTGVYISAPLVKLN
jgi:type VI secretion system secreted protein VgrG